MPRRIVLVSRDADFSVLLSHVLAGHGYLISVMTGDANSRDILPRDGGAEAVLLDSHDALEEALDLCRSLRAQPETTDLPIIALIRACNEHHFFDLKQAGVSECLMRPVSPEMIVNCLRAFTDPPRCPARAGPADDILVIGEIELHHGTRALTSASATVHLSPTEYRILKHLVAKAGRVATRSELVSAAWPAGIHVEPRTVDVHVGHLRRILEKSAGRSMIRTIRSAGFIFEG